jgi:hypothetical protein
MSINAVNGDAQHQAHSAHKQTDVPHGRSSKQASAASLPEGRLQAHATVKHAQQGGRTDGFFSSKVQQNNLDSGSSRMQKVPRDDGPRPNRNGGSFSSAPLSSDHHRSVGADKADGATNDRGTSVNAVASTGVVGNAGPFDSSKFSSPSSKSQTVWPTIDLSDRRSPSKESSLVRDWSGMSDSEREFSLSYF